ncbi:MAG: hypothetical protein H0T73_10290 [Ardenticatenales bacterium]|nr:hypothetical protein [Ardenticatenales bacterium]
MEAWRDLELSQLKLEPSVTALIGQLLRHIEVLEGEIVLLRAENQALRDEINRLKGQKGRPEFKPNQPPRPTEEHAQNPVGNEPRAGSKE